MKFEFDVQITPKVLYDYMLQHTYKQAITILASAAGMVGIAVGLMYHYWVYLIFGILLVIYTPLSLLRRSYMQSKMVPAFQKPLHYTMTDTEILVVQDSIEDKIAWENCYKAVSTPTSIILYTAKRSAFIFPKNDLGDKTSQLIEVISTHMPPNKVKIRS